MDLARLVLLSALLCHASSASPIAANRPLGKASTTSGDAVPVLSPLSQQQHGSYHPQDPPIRNRGSLNDAGKPIAGRNVPANPPGLNVANVANFNQDALTVMLNQPAAACTATVSKTPWKCPSWDGTFTIYPSATLATTSVDCKGCDYVFNDDEIHFCPNMPISITTMAKTASTFWTTVCAKSPGALAQVTQPAAAAITPASNAAVRARVPAPEPAQGTAILHPLPGGPAPDACPTTVVVQPEQSAGKTQTSFARWTTTTLYVPCGGCPLVVTTGLVGYGPPGVFTKTTTIPVGTKTAYACA
ncbi:hypothetical protein QBC34DRAFT_305720 [Podospora aff. communis PSN243]|uniref:Uncharacterized protein n=1 Tax=Podospora aff. communis PSN243 TaxID=3040156 RepID=A0AAV9GC08_9PEZI|nr:hypothetical protein QBC34DRAFT_305720 [Podospora aff. communis PSN243]